MKYLGVNFCVNFIFKQVMSFWLYLKKSELSNLFIDHFHVSILNYVHVCADKASNANLADT